MKSKTNFHLGLDWGWLWRKKLKVCLEQDHVYKIEGYEQWKFSL